MRSRLDNHKLVAKPKRPIKPKVAKPTPAKKNLPRPHKRKG